MSKINMILKSQKCYTLLLLALVWAEFAMLFAFGYLSMDSVRNNATQAWWDERTYIGLSYNFIGDNGFSLLNFPETVRGYFFPLITGALFVVPYFFDFYWAAGDFMAWSVYYTINWIMLAVTIVVLLPDILGIKPKGKRGIIGATVMPVIIFLFFRWLLYDVLTDHWALFFCLFSIYMLKRAVNSENNYLTRLLLGLGGGIWAYAAYNTRTIYIFAFFTSIVLVILPAISKDFFKTIRAKAGKFVLIIVGIVIGFVLLGIPEGIINQNHYGKFDIMLNTQYDGHENLFLFQLDSGIPLDRYESSVFDDGEFPFGGVGFENESGILMQQYLAEQKLTGENFQLKTVLHMIHHYPLDTCVIYFRHLLSMITPIWADVYISNPYTVKEFMILGNCIVFTLLIISLISKKNTTKDKRWLFVPLITVAVVLFGAIEVRFALPLFFIVWAHLCFQTDYWQMWQWFKGAKLIVILVAGALNAFYITVIADVLFEAGLLFH